MADNGHAETSTGFAVGNEFPNGEAALDELVAIAQKRGMGYEVEKHPLTVEKRSPGLTPVEMEAVNRPAHYRQGEVEVIDIIEQIVAGYKDPVVAGLVWQVLKYLARAPHKGNLQQDLGKAEWYMKRAVNKSVTARDDIK